MFACMQERVVGRPTTELEEHYAFKHGTFVLLKRVEYDGENVQWDVAVHVSALYHMPCLCFQYVYAL